MCSADETSEQINQVKSSFPDRPVFVTGFHCVGMSVTFISKETGNFDNVIFSHNHFPSDVQYQLCRFLFNHNKWSEQERLTIKKTKLFIGKGCSEMLQNCLEYESQVDLIDQDVGSSTKDKWSGVQSIKKIPREKKFDPTRTHNHFYLKVTVDDDEEDGQMLWRRFKIYKAFLARS